MSLDINFIGVVIASIMASSVPLILAASGELITERSGVLNLGVEGMMIIGARQSIGEKGFVFLFAGWRRIFFCLACVAGYLLSLCCLYALSLLALCSCREGV